MYVQFIELILQDAKCRGVTQMITRKLEFSVSLSYAVHSHVKKSATALQKTWNLIEPNELLPRAILRVDIPPCHIVPPHSNEIVKSTAI